MSAVTEPVKHDVIPGFDEDVFLSVGAGEPAILRAKRVAAFAAYLAAPTPTVRDEEWRRVTIEQFPFGQASRLADLVPAAATNHAWDDSFDVVVTIDGATQSIRSNRNDINVLTLKDAAQKFPQLIEQYLQGPALPKEPRKFELLNQAFWNAGLLVHVPRNVKVEKGILIRYSVTQPKTALLPRLLFIMESGSEASVVEHFSSPNGIPLLSIGSREFYVGANAILKLAAIQEWGDQVCHLGEDWAQVGRDGKIDWTTITLGSQVSKMMVGSNVAEANAQAYLSGIFFADGKQRFDQKTLQLHSSPDTYSNLLYKGAVKDEGYSVYQGIINAKPGAIRVDAYQMNNNLILNEGARADSLPGLEIDADDLKCSHGSTMGTLDPEQVYYLRSRGLNELDAQRLLVTAFFEEVITRLPHEFLRDHVRNRINDKMAGTFTQ